MTRTRQVLRNLTFANQLTFLRLAVIPFFVLALLDNQHTAALVLFGAAAVTDTLDGLIARILKQQTALGALLDPIADKLLLTTALVCLTLPDHIRVAPEFTLVNRVPIWLTVLALSRDMIILVTVGVLYLIYGITRFPPSRAGKLTTFSLVVLVSLVLWFNSRETVSPLAVPIAAWTALGFTLGSGLHYVFRTGQLIREVEPPLETP
jgi:cardiolipin synthase